MALTTNLISYWSLGEASGNALDAHGSNNLTETSGTIASTTGKVGNCRDFEAGDTEHFTIANNASVITGDIDFSIACWVNFESLPGGALACDLVSHFVISGTGGGEWLLGYNDSTDRFRLLVRNAADSANAIVEANNFGAASTGTWYFVVGWHDSVANTINIQVNNGTVDTLAHSAGVFTSAGAVPFRIGARGNDTSYFDGLIDEAAFWKRVLTSDERTFLYNAGNGRSYADVVAGIPVAGASIFSSEPALFGGMIIR